jgi:hypothetical protein
MARMNDWQREIHDGVRREKWSLKGPDMVVKVIMDSTAQATALEGYITVGSNLVGKTPEQIRVALGLKELEPEDVQNGCSIFRFKRLPMAHEYAYELTAAFPDGLAFNPAHYDARWKPGSPSIHQWCIKKDMAIPVDTKNVLRLKPGQPFPYDWLTA